MITRQTDVQDSGVQTTRDGKDIGTATVTKGFSDIMAEFGSSRSSRQKVFQTADTMTFYRSDGYLYMMKVVDRMASQDFANVTFLGNYGIKVQLINNEADSSFVARVVDPTDAGRVDHPYECISCLLKAQTTQSPENEFIPGNGAAGTRRSGQQCN